ncbi:MAG: sodium:solute symporter [Bacteroidota bacterium]
MNPIDWIIMLGTLFGIVAYGVWKTRKVNNVQSYLLGDRDLPWWTIGLSIMATQASAITFLSTPGQAYESGMGFAQFYFGLPLAMVILAIFFLPIYYRLKVYTAYEYLESRFDLKTRTLTAVLFLVQRGLAAGLTIYAPAIILSTILGWNLQLTILFIGAIVIFYTVLGGTKAVSVTQKQQMIVILGGMFIAAIIILLRLPEDVTFGNALNIAGKMGKLEVVDFDFDLSQRYNIWSGMIGGVFLFLSYFGTDQSQVQRYLSGKSLTESRLGLLFNGIFKVPMQFSVLLIGILVFVFFLFTKPPVHFNQGNINSLAGTPSEIAYQDLSQQYDRVFDSKKAAVQTLMSAFDTNDEGTIETAKTNLNNLQTQENLIRTEVKNLIIKENPAAKTKDTDYVFITFVMNYLPVGLIGLLLAVIFSAAMSSTASELNALATTTVIDLYKRSMVTDKDDKHYLVASKWVTIMWGGIALIFASTAGLFDNLIQAVNIIGSIFYGAILGIFLLAFFFQQKDTKSRTLGAFTGAVLGAILVGYYLGELTMNAAILGGMIGGLLGLILIHLSFKGVSANAVFWGAITGEMAVLYIFYLNRSGTINISYLWLNLIGCVLVILFALTIQTFMNRLKRQAAPATPQ